MEGYDPSWLSLLPALVTITLAFVTRQVVPALFFGIVTGSVVLYASTAGCVGPIAIKWVHPLAVLAYIKVQMRVFCQARQANFANFLAGFHALAFIQINAAFLHVAV